jgi:UDP-N-acetylmuramoyl-L-alanyl-D-glutamate--2,6-diaminopimelate ligase
MSYGLATQPMTVHLRRIFPSASFVGCGDLRVSHATERASECRADSLFAVIRGMRCDGHAFVQGAIANGATALLVDKPLVDVRLPQCVVPDTRRAYAELCAAIHQHPSRQLALAGITGTNGKTTITWMVRSICQVAGHQTGLLGTIEYSDGACIEPSVLTTPDAATFNAWLQSMVVRGTTHAAVELSSHALEQRRVAGTLLDAAVISNITRDHFDYHGTFEAYRDSKLRIFNHLKPAGLAIVNMDDPGSRGCLEDAPARGLTYGVSEPADVTALVLDESLYGTRFRLAIGAESVLVESRLPGRHNVSNCLAAAAVAHHLGIGLADIARGIDLLDAVPGRVESVDCGQPFHVFVDYAHTDDALERCLRFLKSQCTGRVLCVFGAGGDRDREKRPLLARAASQADIAILTSDNPRTEDPARILDDVARGFAGTTVQPQIIPDRAAAIREALSSACPGDCVLIAGKGHETVQIVGTVRHEFDDREVAREVLRRLSAQHEPHLRARSSRVPA